MKMPGSPLIAIVCVLLPMSAKATHQHEYEIHLAYSLKRNIRLQVFTEHHDEYVNLEAMDERDKKMELDLISYNVQIDCPEEPFSELEQSKAAPEQHTCNAVNHPPKIREILWMLVEVYLLVYPRMAWLYIQNAMIRSRFTPLTIKNADSWIASHRFSLIVVSSQDHDDHITSMLANLPKDVPVGTVHGWRQRELLSSLGIQSWPGLFLIDKQAKSVLVKYEGTRDGVREFFEKHRDHEWLPNKTEFSGCFVRAVFQTHGPYLAGTVRVAIADQNADLSHSIKGQTFQALPGYRYFWHNGPTTHASYSNKQEYFDKPHIVLSPIRAKHVP